MEPVRAPLAFLFTLSCALASAQSAHIAHPVYLELGALFPNYRGARFGTDVGVAAGLGYSFAERGDFRLSGELRGAYHLASLGGGGASGVSARDGNLTIGSALMGVRHRHSGTEFFTGLFVGVGQAHIEGGDDQAAALFAAEVGYGFTTRLYLAARYQLATEDALRGATVSLGIRF